MIFGTVFTGQVKTQEKQYIESKLFCFIVPLSVITTMLVTEVTPKGRLGLQIKTNKTSIIAAAIRPLISIPFIFSFIAFLANYDTMFWLLVPTLILFFLFVYAWFFFGKTTKSERFIRSQFGKQLGLYFMPNWLKSEDLKGMFEVLKNKYTSEFGDTDWKEKFKTISSKNDNFSLVFCLTALENEIIKDPKIDKLIKSFTLE